jgi:hypothetical protein
MKKTILSICLLSLAGCSSTPQEQIAKQQAAIEKKQEEQVKKIASNIPDWFLDYSPFDGELYYAAATSTSTDPHIALDDAKTLAVAEIARMASAKVSSQKAISQRNDSSSRGSTVTKLTVDEFTAGKNMAGYNVNKRELFAEGGLFRAYVLVSFKNNAAISQEDLNQLKQDHDELVKRVEAAERNQSGENQ